MAIVVGMSTNGDSSIRAQCLTNVFLCPIEIIHELNHQSVVDTEVLVAHWY